ncbi:MAG TPA: alpha/beta fold hydrolase [Candidatus Binatia bacterium]|nr:alpha/beta fold hydrolase [Candidatus Binatia bacterium]
MSTYVLVHGSWHGAWCWEKIVPLLERAGHVVRAPDLPGHGDDKTPIAEVSSEGYVGRVGEILESLAEPAILVGHSMGGMVISQVAERRPDKVRALAYVAGFLLRDGQSVLDAAQTDGESLLMPSLEWAADGLSAVVPPVAARNVFYGGCPDADAAAAAARLCAEPAVPVMTPIRVTETRFGRIPRVYVECCEDRAVSPSLQRAMYAATPCARVVSLATDHSPFYSKPDELAAILLSLSQ